jgi:acetoin utilization deacetylase AcuC-like enzyme
VPLTIFTTPRFADHLTPAGHPERVQRFEMMQLVTAEFRKRGGRVLEPRAVLDEELRRVHDAEHIGLIKETAGRNTVLDADTVASKQTYEVACLAAGAAVNAVDHVLDGPAGTRAFALVRPPGHHAERNRAMGFCFFNNIGVAAAHARAKGLSRVAVVDYDVHHGNGTQWSFYDDSSVLFVSSHQYPFYPGTGAAHDVGRGRGAGFTVNLPLAESAGDPDLERAYTKIALPVLRQFKPELILISAGFDAYVNDPLGGLSVSADYFGRLTAALLSVADECCGGRVVAVTEGGYDLQGLAACLRVVVGVLDGGAGVASRPAPQGDTSRGDATVAAVQPHLAKHWTL